MVVFSPQIIENFRRSSAEGLSIEFVIIWLLGDFANIIGAVAQKVLPTMIILAIYYTIADIVLLAQCFYYRGFTLRDPRPDKPSTIEDGNGHAAPSETSPLLRAPSVPSPGDAEMPRHRSTSNFRERFTNQGELFSPTMPMHAHPQPDMKASLPPAKSKPRVIWKSIVYNIIVILVVIIAGVAGWYISPSKSQKGGSSIEEQDEILTFSTLGQVFGYLCAALYLGSRLPQLLLNYRRKSTEGLNALFFLFACIGNLTYVLSIFAFEPICRHGHCAPGEAKDIYGRYILVNLSWLLGSLGTLFLDAGVFVQFFMYRHSESRDDHASIGTADDEPRDENGDGRGRSPGQRQL